MDALELLKVDHEKVKSLFEQFKNSRALSERQKLFASIRAELEPHTFAEETVFYPAFRRHPELSALIERFFLEHQTVKFFLAEAERVRDRDAELTEKVQQIIESVATHIQEEENTLFPAVRAHMKRPDRERLGRLIDASKREGKVAA